MKILFTKKVFARFTGALISALSLLWGQAAFAEVQYNISMTMSEPEIGANASFSASDSTSSGSGTFYKTYSGIGRYVLGSTVSGRYTGFANTTRYGVDMGSFHIFQSFLTANSFTIVSSNTTCPSSTTYGFINVRMRAPNASRNPMDASSTSFKAGGVFTYDQAANPDISATSYFDLAGPTLTSSAGAFTANGISGASCSSGKYNIALSGATVWDNYNSLFFGATGGVIVGMNGTPIVSVLSPIEDLTVGRMGQLSGRAMSGLYTEYTGATVTSKQVYLFPDGSGTTFTLREITDFDDPNQYSTYGTLVCTSRNSPTTGFCSGTITKNGEGGSGKMVCQVSKRDTSDVLTCAGQKPSDNTVSVSIIARNFGKSLVAVTLPSPTFTLPSATTSDVTATVRNLSGNPVVTMGIPSAPGDRLTAPFSLPNAFTGSGGTCGSSLNAYQSCNLTLRFSPSDPGVYSQVLRVEYDNQIATVNATANVIGSVSLSSIAITPAGPFTEGGTQQFTATATYSDMSTQDVTAAVVWATSNSGRATITSGGLGSFVTTGTVDVTATLGSTVGSRTITINSAAQPPAGDFAISQPDGTADTVAKGEPFTIRFTGGADPDSNADVYFYAKATNTNCSAGLTGWGTALNASTPAKENSDSGMTWDTSAVAAGSYYICGQITDGTNTVYAVSSGTVTISSTSSAKFITLVPTSTSEKPYNFVYDLYENTLASGSTLDATNDFSTNTTDRAAESKAVAAGAQGTITWASAYKACTLRFNDTAWRLPTAQEFEVGAAGYPASTNCNFNTGAASAAVPYNSGSCVSTQGLYDMGGNLLEWVDLRTTSTAGTLGSTSIKVATDAGSAWVGKTAANYNSQVLQASGLVTKWDPNLGIPSTTGSLTTGFTSGDSWTRGDGASYAYPMGGYYNTGNNAGGRYWGRLDRSATTYTHAAYGFRCAKSRYDIPAVAWTSPASGSVVAPDGSNNVDLTFQAHDSDDNATIALYYKDMASGSSGCSGEPTDNGWTAIDTALAENTNTSKTFNVAALSTAFYHVCAKITDNKNSPRYALSSGVFKKGSPTDQPDLTINEPTGNNDTINEIDGFSVTFTASDFDHDATITLYGNTSNTGCSGTPTSNGWTAMTTTPSSISENSHTSATWTTLGTTLANLPANIYVCGMISDGGSTSPNYSVSGGYITVKPSGACILEDSAFTTASGGCKDNGSSGLTWSSDSGRATNTAYNHANATTYCSNLVEGGYSDWRLPTSAEMTTVAGRGASTHLSFSYGSAVYRWSSTINGSKRNAVRFSDSSVVATATTSTLYTICVRP